MKKRKNKWYNRIVMLLVCLMVTGSVLVPLTEIKGAETVDIKKRINAGNTFAGVIKEDGSLWMWGRNHRGQLGDGTTDNQSVPVKILEDAVAISFGYDHGAAIKSDGSLWTWGLNYYGQIGNGTRNNLKTYYEPTKVMEDVKAVSLGQSWTAALKNDGSLWTWGDNSYGELGIGKNEKEMMYSPDPIKIMEGVVDVQVGTMNGGALKEDGTLWMWGNNEYGQVDNSEETKIYQPVLVMDHVKKIDIGGLAAGAIKEDGSLWLWGLNNNGQLGDGTTENKNVPVKIMEQVKEIALGITHSAVIKEDDSLWIWGGNDKGQLGIETEGTCQTKPVLVMNDVAEAAMGLNMSLAIKNDGNLWAWGKNQYGEVGNGSNEPVLSPVMILENVMKPVEKPTTTETEKPTTTEAEKPTTTAQEETTTASQATTEKQPEAEQTTDHNTQTKPEVSKKKQTISIGSKYQLVKNSTKVLAPKVLGKAKLTFKSSNTKKVVVSKKGKITAKNYGKAIVTIYTAATDRYQKASKRITVCVVPKKSVLKNVTSPQKKTVNIRWKTDKTVKGYQLCLSTKKDFQGSKIVRTYKSSTGKATLKGLKKKTVYYVRIRAYKKVGTTNYYGPWSTTRKVFVKG